MVFSQDDLNKCNEGRRESDVLISTIEKCEKLEEKLKIAKEALEFCSSTYPMCNLMIVEQALAKIKE